MTDETTVQERKFNGTATFKVEANSKDKAKAGARKFWKEEYDTNPSRVVAEKGEGMRNMYTVMVADHSSGSLKGSKTYEL